MPVPSTPWRPLTYLPCPPPPLPPLVQAHLLFGCRKEDQSNLLDAIYFSAVSMIDNNQAIVSQPDTLKLSVVVGTKIVTNTETVMSQMLCWLHLCTAR